MRKIERERERERERGVENRQATRRALWRVKLKDSLLALFVTAIRSTLSNDREG